MKLRSKLFSTILCLAVLFAFTGLCLAEDVQLNTSIERVIVKKDKNGSPYARLLIQDKAELNGIAYEKTVSAMVFGDLVPTASKLKKGDKLSAIASKGEYRGNVSYQVLKFLN